jgi:hypothetical protein
MSCGSQTLMFHLLLDAILPEFYHCLEIYTFSALQRNFNLKMTEKVALKDKKRKHLK